MAKTAAASTSSSSPKKMAKAKKAVKSPKAAAPAEAKKRASKPRHPTTADMVIAAIRTLNERGGSSLYAIKKYILNTYNLDTERSALLIRRYLKSAVTEGTLIQSKGKGASGSFKLPPAKASKKLAGKLAKAEKAEKSIKNAEEQSLKATLEPVGKSTSLKPKKATAAKKTVEKPVSAEVNIKSSSKSSPKVKKTAKFQTKPKASKSKKTVAPKAAAASK